jgi:hypothetical protein
MDKTVHATHRKQISTCDGPHHDAQHWAKLSSANLVWRQAASTQALFVSWHFDQPAHKLAVLDNRLPLHITQHADAVS